MQVIRNAIKHSSPSLFPVTAMALHELGAEETTQMQREEWR